MIQELSYDRLCRVCDLEGLRGSMPQAGQPKTIIGQERAVRALMFGLGIKDKGFNIYASGRPGTGRTTAIYRFLEEAAAGQPAPLDWCYVNNVHDAAQPHVLRLPAGRALQLKGDMEGLVAHIARDVRNAFESEEYTANREGVVKKIQEQKRVLLDGLNEQAARMNFAIQPSAVGVLTIPLHRGKPITEQEFMALKPEEKEHINQTQQELEATIDTVLRQAKGLDKSAAEALQKLDRQVALFAIKHPMSDMQQKYQDVPDVLIYLEQVQTDILANIPDFKPESEEQPALPLPFMPSRRDPLKKYIVNVLVDNSEHNGAPVVIERNPTYTNLFGKIEQEAQFGALVTDFTLIRPGSLHKANGGYLVLPIAEVISSPLSWESLKLALQNQEIVVEDASDKLGLVSTRSLKPEPIPLDVKVILVGQPNIYELLLEYDEHFGELFKVKADFDTQMQRTPEHVSDYAAFIQRICEEEKLKPVDAGGMARIVEHGSRLAEDQDKLSTHFGRIADVIREASYYAGADNAVAIGLEHVRKAIDEHFYRSALIQERIQEMILRDEIKIDVDGKKCGQVNGLSVLQLGDIEFGQPSRITVSIGLGREGLVDIEREAKMGGPIHTKGVMILSGYLTDKFAQDKPLSLAARLVFEQSYSGVEGDSASSTELYTILSALADLPVDQGIAVTGSVNQKGEVQAIGGVNEKIEGFFEICQKRGLTGKQGVIIPESNVCNLMLKESVVQAVRDGQFHVWPVKSIDQGIEILTGVKAGERLPDGGFEEDSVFGRADRRLNQLAERLEAFGKKDDGKGDHPA